MAKWKKIVKDGQRPGIYETIRHSLFSSPSSRSTLLLNDSISRLGILKPDGRQHLQATYGASGLSGILL